MDNFLIQSFITCEKPTILVNKLAFIHYLRGCPIYFLNHDGCEQVVDFEKFQCVDFSLFTRFFIRYQELLNVETYELFYVLSGCDRIPLFNLIPCNHCDLCCSRKSSSLAFRAACETATYPDSPLFITLTYAPSHLPSLGLVKDDVQRFFKRLRSRLAYRNLPTDFRYLAVGEYSPKNTRRAHYHIIIWNFPVKSFSGKYALKNAYGFIRRAWSDFTLDENGRRIFRKIGRKCVFLTHPIGHVLILPVTKGCPSYVTKYALKGSHTPPGKNPPFVLMSSKGGSIGSRYIDSVIPEIHNGLSLISVFDPIAKKTFSSGINSYIMRRAFPSFHQYMKNAAHPMQKLFMHFRRLCVLYESLSPSTPFSSIPVIRSAIGVFSSMPSFYYNKRAYNIEFSYLFKHSYYEREQLFMKLLFEFCKDFSDFNSNYSEKISNLAFVMKRRSDFIRSLSVRQLKNIPVLKSLNQDDYNNYLIKSKI